MSSSGQCELKKLFVMSDQQQNRNDRLCWRHNLSVNGLQELPAQYHVVKTLAPHCHCDVCSAAVGILQGVERPGSVYSIMPQWW